MGLVCCQGTGGDRPLGELVSSEQPWACECHLIDPDGNRLCVGTPKD